MDITANRTDSEEGPWAGRTMAGGGSRTGGSGGTDCSSEGLRRLPRLCGYCRTLYPDLDPEFDDICRDCMRSGNHIDWAMGEAVEGWLELDDPGCATESRASGIALEP